MDKEKLLDAVDRRLTQRQIASELKTSHTNIRYWLKRFNLKTLGGVGGRYSKDYTKLRKCKCGETNPEKFYGNKTRTCSACHNIYTYKKAKENRQLAIEYLGGMCSQCGYNAHDCALDIHHKDPKSKDPNFSKYRGWSKDRLLKELIHCILLCKNCHAIHHKIHGV